MVKRLWAIRTVLVGLLGGFGLGLILCWFLYLRPVYSLYFALCGGIGGIASIFHGNRNAQYAIALGLALCVGVLGAVLSHWSAVVVAGLTVYVLAFGGGTMGGYGFYAPMGIWSILALLGAVLTSGGFPQLWKYGALGAMALALGLTLDGFRANSLRKAMMQRKNDSAIRNPSGILENSFWMYLGFVGLGLVAAAVIMVMGFGLWQIVKRGWGYVRFYLLQDGAGIFGWFGSMVIRFVRWFQSLFHGKEDHPDIEMEETLRDDGWQNLVYGASAVATVILVVVSALAAAGMVTGLVMGIVRRAKSKPRLIEGEDYVDEIEALERPRKHRRFHRQSGQSFSGFADDRLKIRFAFQQLLRRRKEKDNLAHTKTPNELRQE
ncbi:MAG: hypothetical protein PUC06_03975, partial [Oscillospiraceae bacterium]|nr:hypothetical protein [Oscillospiraceae bacterium]